MHSSSRIKVFTLKRSSNANQPCYACARPINAVLYFAPFFPNGKNAKGASGKSNGDYNSHQASGKGGGLWPFWRAELNRLSVCSAWAKECYLQRPLEGFRVLLALPPRPVLQPVSSFGVTGNSVCFRNCNGPCCCTLESRHRRLRKLVSLGRWRPSAQKL